MSWQPFFRQIFLISLLGMLISCAGSSPPPNFANEAFEEKYGEVVKQINSSRTPSPQALSTNNTGEDFSPNDQTFSAGQNSLAPNELPEDIFEITYNTEPSPPFVASGIEFDLIDIPTHDAYGVASTLNEKQFALAGNSSLQKNIDQLLASKNKDDAELSEILIKEQKQLAKEQKIINIFSDNSASEEKNNEPIAEEKSLIENSLHKAIALQIIQQNLQQNASAASAEANKNKQQKL